MTGTLNIEAIAAVGIYAVLNGFIMFWLASSTGSLRRKYKIAIGDGGNAHLTRILRGSANAVENIPLTLILLLITAMMGMPVYALHISGILFTIGRLSHAWYFIQEDAPFWQRFGGFLLGMSITTILALGILVHAIWIMIPH